MTEKNSKKDSDVNINSKSVRESIQKLANSIRAERNVAGSLLDIYADVAIIERLNNRNNQIIYGRRGSGKTHLLLALAEVIEQNNDSDSSTISVYIDLRKVLPLVTEHDETKLETSVLIFQHIINELISGLSLAIPKIFSIGFTLFKDSRTSIKEEQIRSISKMLNLEFNGKEFNRLGNVEFSEDETRKIAGSLNASKDPSISANAGIETKKSRSKKQIKYISFSEVSELLGNLLSVLNDINVTCLLDEWSELPLNLQPYISELLKRTFIASNYTLKIAAIPYRSKFRDNISDEHKIGLEEGGDVFPITLDNRHVFEVDKNETREFYNELLYKHLISIDKNYKRVEKKKFINMFLANQALSEILIASAGIPRDFMNLFILSYSNRIDKNKRIILRDIRSATTEWYKTDKKEEIEKDNSTRSLFKAIVERIVIEKNRTHFLMPKKYSDNRHIKKLVDLRALHLRQEGISHKHFANKQYDAYSIDYGSYTSIDIQKRSLDTDFPDLKTSESVRDARAFSIEDEFFEKFFLEIGEGIICKSCNRTIDTNHLAYTKQKLCNNCYEKVE